MVISYFATINNHFISINHHVAMINQYQLSCRATSPSGPTKPFNPSRLSQAETQAANVDSLAAWSLGRSCQSQFFHRVTPTKTRTIIANRAKTDDLKADVIIRNPNVSNTFVNCTVLYPPFLFKGWKSQLVGCGFCATENSQIIGGSLGEGALARSAKTRKALGGGWGHPWWHPGAPRACAAQML